MLKTSFSTEIEANVYLEEQKIRMERGYLSCSERKQLKKMLENPKAFVHEVKEKKANPNVREIIHNLNKLRIPCKPVEPGEDISQIIVELKETLAHVGGVGLSANQIGYCKQISYIKMVDIDKKNKKLRPKELLLINPKIVEHDRKFTVKGEECLSFPRIRVDTDRWVFITLVNHNEKLEATTSCYQDFESVVIQHEVDHLQGKTIFNRKHKRR